MFDSCGALYELSAEQLDTTASFHPPELPLVATATQIFTFCPGFLTLRWSGVQHACVSACVCEGCVTCVHRGASGANIKATMVSYGGESSFSPGLLTKAKASGTLLIMAVLPRSCLFGARLKRKKGGWMVKDRQRCKSNSQAC